MEVCGVSVVVGKDGREYIIKASDSTFALMGDTQEEDRRQIADLVTARMQVRTGISYNEKTLSNLLKYLPERLSSRHESTALNRW